MVSKLTLYGSVAIIVFFALSLFAVVLTPSSSPTPTPSPTPSATANFAGSAIANARILGFAPQYLVECSPAPPATPQTVLDSMLHATLTPPSPSPSPSPIPSNSSNSSTNATTPFTPVASAFQAGSTIFVAVVNSSALLEHHATLSPRSYFLSLALALAPACQANVVRNAIVSFDSPVAFTADSGGTTRTVYPRDFSDYAQGGSGAVAGFGAPVAGVNALVLPGVRENDSVPVSAHITFSNNAITELVVQESLNPAGSNVISMNTPAQVDQWLSENGSALAQASVPWPARHSLDIAKTAASLNSSPGLTLASFEYAPVDSIILSNATAWSDNRTLDALKRLPGITSVSPPGDSIVLAVNSTLADEKAAAILLSTARVPGSAIIFPASNARAVFTLKGNSSAQAIAALVSAGLPTDSPVLVRLQARVTLTDLRGASELAGAVLPLHFTTFVSPDQVDAQNYTELSLNATVQGMRVLAVSSESVPLPPLHPPGLGA